MKNMIEVRLPLEHKAWKEVLNVINGEIENKVFNKTEIEVRSYMFMNMFLFERTLRASFKD